MRPLGKHIWIEHKQINAAPRQVEELAFESLYAAKGWTRCDPPENTRAVPAVAPDPDKIRLEEIRNRKQANSLPDLVDLESPWDDDDEDWDEDDDEDAEVYGDNDGDDDEGDDDEG